MGSHWYKRDGTPFYTIVGANGKERDTNVRDARKEGALYSYSTINKQLNKVHLNRWSLNKMLQAAFEEPRKLDMPFDLWKKRVWDRFNIDTSIYATIGNEVHNKLENFYKTGLVEPEDEDLLYPVIEAVNNLGYNIAEAEVSFACKEGYGGKVDLVLDQGAALVDFKTKQDIKLDKTNLYFDYCMQLAAYREAINPKAKCYNIVVSVNNPGEVFCYEWSEDELKKGYRMFKLLLEYAFLDNNYDPREVVIQ